jgi:hypothetical protein
MKPIVDQGKNSPCMYELVLTSLIEYESSAIKQLYEQLQHLPCSTLILWGRQDRV